MSYIIFVWCSHPEIFWDGSRNSFLARCLKAWKLPRVEVLEGCDLIYYFVHRFDQESKFIPNIIVTATICQIVDD